MGQMPPKDTDRMEDSADPDTQSDLGLHCLLWPIYLKA